MKIPRTVFLPHCRGLFIRSGVLYAQRYRSDAEFTLLTTPEQRAAYLAPIPISLEGAQVFFDIGVGERHPIQVPGGARVIAPTPPPSKPTARHFTVLVQTSDNNVYVGYPTTERRARNFFGAIDGLVTSICAPPKQ